MMRLNKFIAHYSTYSRREADKLIQEGYVKVDGLGEENPATQVDERENEVTVRGKKIHPSDEFTVIVYNKPKGEIVTKSDPQGRKTIYHSLPSKFKHFIPVGRLDYATEGVILLTDSSHVANALMNSDVERVYKVKIKGPITKAMTHAMENGMILEDATAGAHEKTKITSMTFAPFYGYMIQKDSPNYSILKISISEGQNREIRRFFAHFDAEVADLKRVNYGGVELNALPTGKNRFLARNEYVRLREFLRHNRKELKHAAANKQNAARQAYQNSLKNEKVDKEW